MRIRGEASASVRAGGGAPPRRKKCQRLRPDLSDDLEIRARVSRLRPCRAEDKRLRGEASASVRAGGGAPAPVNERPWDRDEWEVAVGDAAVYRIFRHRGTDGWFIDAIVD